MYTATLAKRTTLTLAAALACTAIAAPAHAVVGYADVVLDYFNSGAGSFAGPYGGTFPGAVPGEVPTSVVLGNAGAVVDFLSLPTGSYVTVGFTDEIVTNGVGNDIFIQEVGGNGEKADVFVSSDFINFVFLGLAIDNGVTSFDLASIGFAGQVKALKIVGLDAGGASPGFDVVNIQALPGSITAVPEPATWALMIGGFGLMGSALRRRAALRVA